MALLTFAVTLFSSAFLLFLVQPIIGQKILPKLGGTPSVWNTCVVFFQCTLLIGYAYTHFTTKLPVRRQILIHCCLLFVPFLILLPAPFSVESFRPVTGGNPTLYTLGLLAMIVGIPFFVVSTTAPLLQKWFGATGHPAAKDPYFLYGASNLGSMLSLLLYPPVFEPLFGLEAQSWFYTVGYVILVAMVVGCGAMAFMAPPTVQIGGKKADEQPEHVPAMQPEPPPVTDIAAGPAPSVAQTTEPPSTAVSSGPPPAASAPFKPTTATGIKKGGKKGKGRDLAKAAPSTAIAPAATASAIAAAAATPSITVKTTHAADADDITWPRRLRWIGLAAVPSSLMLGVTTYMSTDISAIPLFWVLPLALYLLSFILVFMRWPIHWLEQAHEAVLYAQPIALAVLALMLVIGNASIIVWMIAAMIVAFTLTCLACHGEMAKDRPSAKHLTEFYLLMSVGGAIGGLFNGILAPVIFKDFGVVEFGLALAAAGLLRPTMRDMGWTEMLFNSFSDSGEAGKHHHGKGGKKITRSTADTAALTMGLDFVLPIAVLALLGLTLAIFQPGRGEGGVEQLFYAFIVPIICTACFFARPLRFGLALAGVLLVTGMYLESGSLFQTRSYFGVLRVRAGKEGYGDIAIDYTNLTHGTTHHGMCLQYNDKVDLSRVATTYYHRQGPVGISMDRFNWFPIEYADAALPLSRLVSLSDARMPASLVGLGVPGLGVNLPMAQLVGVWSEPPYAVIGMGTATMATYARPYTTCHFYEIDEQIRLLSLPDDQRKPYFGYVQAARKRGANVQILMGDARLRMAMPWVPDDPAIKDLPTEVISEKHFGQRGGPEYYYHLMVVDAFSSDAIPRHLITKEAIEMYMQHLKQGHWGDWIEVDPKDETKDIHGERIDTSRLYDSDTKREGDKFFKRWWFPGGMLCVHTSNRHLRLVPVVTDTCGVAEWVNQYSADKSGKADKKVKGLIAWRGHDNAPGHSAKDPRKNQKDDIGHFTSEWVIVARDEKDLKHLKEPSKYKEWCDVAFPGANDPRRTDPYWARQHPTGTYVWTDDHSNLMAVFRWPWSRHSD